MPLPEFRVVPLPVPALEPPQAPPAEVTGPSTVVLATQPRGDGAQVLAGGAEIARRLGVDLAGHLARAHATGAAAEVVTIPLVPAAGSTVDTLLLVGVADGSAAAYAKAGAGVARAAGKATHVLAVVTAATAGAAQRAGRFVEGYALAAYQLPRWSVRPQEPADVRVDVAVHDPAPATEQVRRAAVVARAVHLARDLANTPANLKSPQWLAERAVAAARDHGLDVRVRDERELAAEGFGGLIGVGQGSARPPRFVELTYIPSGRGRRRHVVLVGKGITFDSGGISIKPAAGMESMKTDMAGAAAVLATMTALADLGVDQRVTGLLAIAENLPGDAALRPADVITPFGGRRSVEITNTDAEGRLVLADALAYADLVLKADAVIDVATLTGAASLALGKLDAPLYATDERLAAALLRASGDTGERLWRMPLVEEYRPALDSGTADLVNGVTDRSVGGGSITAALFLREFTGGRPWAHLDIAGTGRADAAVGELSRGATGFGVRLLLRYLAAQR